MTDEGPLDPFADDPKGGQPEPTDGASGDASDSTSQPHIGPRPSNPAGGQDAGGQPDFAEFLQQMMSGGDIPGMPAGFDPSQLAEMLPGGPAQLGQLFGQVQQMMAGTNEGPVNWDMARNTARQTAAATSDPTPSDADGRTARDAWLLAQSWLDEVVDMPAVPGTAQAWSRAEWVEGTMGTWIEITEPIAASVSESLSQALSSQVPPELAHMLGNASGMLNQIGGSMFGAQVGQAVGTLAGEVMSTFDIGLPLTEDPEVAVLPTNIAEFSEGLEVSEADVRLYVMLREAAHRRLYVHASWLRGLVFETLHAFARGITIDTHGIEEMMGSVDPTDPSSMQAAMEGGVLKPQHSPAQEQALKRLELLLALVEGWVDHVVDQAASARMPSAAALRETMRRRRAAGGPAEHVMTSLVGLELRPRRLRDAAALWAILGQDGKDARDGFWDHPDLLPTVEDLDEPTDGAERLRELRRTSGESDMDAELRKILDAGADNSPADSSPNDGAEGSNNPPRDE